MNKTNYPTAEKLKPGVPPKFGEYTQMPVGNVVNWVPGRENEMLLPREKSKCLRMCRKFIFVLIIFYVLVGLSLLYFLSLIHPNLKLFDVNPVDIYGYRQTPADFCSSVPDLLVIVISKPENAVRRQAIRSTWGQALKEEKINSYELAFFMGKSNDSHLQEALHEEGNTYKDIFEHDFLDTPENNTLKSKAMLYTSWRFCRHAKFVMKVSDDVFINVKNLNSLTQALAFKWENVSLIFGKLITYDVPNRNTQAPNFIPFSHFPNQFFPTYTAGAAYIITSKALYPLYEASTEIFLIDKEDAYITGLCADLAGVPRYEIDGLLLDNACDDSFVMERGVVCKYSSRQSLLTMVKEL